MTKALSKVVYKADAKSTSEYTVIVNPEEVGWPSFLVLIDILNRHYFLVQEMESRR